MVNRRDLLKMSAGVTAGSLMINSSVSAIDGVDWGYQDIVDGNSLYYGQLESGNDYAISIIDIQDKSVYGRKVSNEEELSKSSEYHIGHADNIELISCNMGYGIFESCKAPFGSS